MGDMLELGDYASKMHRKVGRYAVENHVDALFCFGEHAKEILEGAKSAGHLYGRSFDDKMEMAEYLKLWLKPGDAILYKGSRGMKLEEVIEKVHGIPVTH